MADEITNKMSGLKFNLGAAEFVPSWLTSSAPSDSSSTQNSTPASAPSAAQSSQPAETNGHAVPMEVDGQRSASATPSTTKAAPAPKPSSGSSAPTPMAEEEVVDDSAFKGVKEHLNIIFIGHVDAGKSTMGGNILFLTGMVDKRTMEKYEKEAKEAGRESWYLSWALDLNQEERNKGKTVEYGRGYFETEKRRFTIIDAPGHKNYVPSMMQGAAQADVGVLVISARKGEFETGFERGGQTREHAMLAKTAGVKRLIIVINKMDEPTVQWSKERYDECVSKIVPYVKQVGYNPKTDVDILPVSGFTGANIKDRLAPGVFPSYEGPSLLELLDNMEIKDRKYDGPFLMPISDKFKDMGTVVIGKIASGRVKKGQTLLIMPNKKMAEVMAIYAEDSEVNAAQSGDNIRLRLKNVEEDDVVTGFVLCSPSRPVHTVTAFEAQLKIVQHKSIVCAGYTAVLHVHNCVEEISLAALLHMTDKKTGKKSKHPPKFLRQGDIAIVRIETTQPICVETFEDYQQLGRFSLRDEGITVAQGKITKLIGEDI